MTVFVLAQKRIISFRPFAWILQAAGLFSFHNARGAVTLLSLVILGSIIAGYVAALFWSVQLGITISDNERKLASLSEEYIRAELRLHEAEQMFTGEFRKSVAFMEPVRTVHYLMPDTVAAVAPVTGYHAP